MLSTESIVSIISVTFAVLSMMFFINAFYVSCKKDSIMTIDISRR